MTETPPAVELTSPTLVPEGTLSKPDVEAVVRSDGKVDNVDQGPIMIAAAQKLWGPDTGFRWVTTTAQLLVLWNVIRIIAWAIVRVSDTNESDCSYEYTLKTVVTVEIAISSVHAIFVFFSNSDRLWRSLCYITFGFFYFVMSFITLGFFAKARGAGCSSRWTWFALEEIIPAIFFTFCLFNLIWVGIKIHRNANKLENLRFWMWGYHYIYCKRKDQIHKVFHDAVPELSRSFGLYTKPLLPWWIRVMKNYYLWNTQDGLVFTHWNDDAGRAQRKAYTENHLNSHPAHQEDIDKLAAYMVGDLPDREGIRASIQVIYSVWKPGQKVSDALLDSTPGNVMDNIPKPWQVNRARHEIGDNIELYHHLTLGRSDFWINMKAIKKLLELPQAERPSDLEEFLRLAVLGPRGHPEKAMRERRFIGFRIIRLRKLENFFDDGPADIGTVVVTGHEADGNFDDVSTWDEIFLGTCCARFWMADVFRRATALAIEIANKRQAEGKKSQ